MSRLHPLNLFNKPENLFMAIGSFFGIVSVFLVPVLTIPDEGAHFWMSYGMFSQHQQIPSGLLMSEETPGNLIHNGTYFEKIFQNKVNLENDGVQFNISREITINSSNDNRTVSSLDITRLPQAIGIVIAKYTYPSVCVMVILGRLFNLAFYIVCIYFVIKRVRHGKLAIAFLSLFPMLIHQAGSLSYDVVNLVVIFCWVVLMINIYTQKTTLTARQLIVTALLVIALILTKLNNFILLLSLIFMPPVVYKELGILRKIRQLPLRVSLSRRAYVTLFCVGALLALALFIFLLDNYLASRGVGLLAFAKVFFNTLFRPEVNTQLDPIVTTGLVGNFAWLWYRFPEWLVFLHLSVFGLILLGDKALRVSARLAVVSGVLFVLSIFAIILGMYFLWTLDPKIAGPGATFIQGMQGRYFTPLLILLVPVFAYLQRYISVSINKRLLTIITSTTAVFSLTIYVVLTLAFFYW